MIFFFSKTCLLVPGYYVYAEATGRYPGHFGELLGPNLKGSQSCVLSFCYHMYGKTMGNLTVYKRITSDPKPDDTQQQIWTTTGDHGNKWFCTTVGVKETSDFSIVFEATRGNGYQSDIALDDIKFINCGGTALSLLSSKSTFSQSFKEKCISEVARICSIIIFHLSKL